MVFGNEGSQVRVGAPEEGATGEQQANTRRCAEDRQKFLAQLSLRARLGILEVTANVVSISSTLTIINPAANATQGKRRGFTRCYQD